LAEDSLVAPYTLTLWAK